MAKKNQNSVTTEYTFPRIKPSLRQIRQKANSNLPLSEVLCPDYGSRAHLSNYPGRTSSILAPFFRLKANCLNIRSIWFFIICVNRALAPLSCRWLMPKYCFYPVESFREGPLESAFHWASILYPHKWFVFYQEYAYWK